MSCRKMSTYLFLHKLYFGFFHKIHFFHKRVKLYSFLSHEHIYYIIIYIFIYYVHYIYILYIYVFIYYIHYIYIIYNIYIYLLYIYMYIYIMLILILQDMSTACHESLLASINTIYYNIYRQIHLSFYNHREIAQLVMTIPCLTTISRKHF